MFLSHSQSVKLLKDHHFELEQATKASSNTLVICPSFTVLPYTSTLSTSLLFGAQDCSSQEQGAFTGDIFAGSLQELGCTYTLIGHSERRTNHCETDVVIAQKAQRLISQNIRPVLCIGETFDDRLSGASHTKLETQLDRVKHLNIILAYEPVWAIGTGKLPTPQELSDTVAWIKQRIEMPVLYGGSINDHTCEELSSLVDGFLVGKASITVEALKKIILSC
jgi:triosephosphate isomerase (TIM)